MKKISILLLLCLLSYKVKAQNAAEKELGAWYMYNGSHKMSEKFAVKTMAHFRYFEIANEFQQEIYRLGFNYKLNPKMNVTLGYSFVNTDPSYTTPSSTVNEHRIYEDLNISGKIKKFNLKHRIRLEHRFLNSTTSQWFRYNLNVGYPISDVWSVYAFNEIFLNIDRSKRFVQNWTGAGFIHKLNNTVKLKAGYFQIKTPNAVFKRLQFGVILNTNHTKKQ